MYKCPHCNEPGISKARRMFLGPAVPAKCRACGKKVGVPYIATIVAVIPIVITIIAANIFVESLAVRALILIAGFVVSFAIQMLWIPLEPR